MRPELSPGEVHLFRLDLDNADLDECRESLAPDERRHAQRYIFARDRDHFIAARGLLRRILGSYLDREGRDVALWRSANGKPVADGIEFNLSHADEACVVAVARASPVGVDIERIRDDIDLSGIADAWFSVAEREALARIDACHRVRALFTCWSRKEAYLKARGDGLARALSSFEVTAGLDGDVALLCDLLDADASSRWSICDIACPEGYVGALAVAQPDVSLVCFDSFGRDYRSVERFRIQGKRAFS